MAKFIEIETYYQGFSHVEILNIDDIGHISVGPNVIFLKNSIRRRLKHGKRIV